MRLIEERRGSAIISYVYEPDSYAPLARLDADGESTEQGGLETTDDPVLGESREVDPTGGIQPTSQQSAANDSLEAQYWQVLSPSPNAVRKTGTDDNARLCNVYYFHTDQVGMPQELANAQGQVIWQASYKTWGSTVSEEWEAKTLGGSVVHPLDEGDSPTAQDERQQNLRFQGQYLDRETGLHYNTFRYYDADVGRFVCPDPIGLGGGTNLGSYSPNPISWIDPLGWTCAASTLPQLRGKSVAHVEKILAKAGFRRANPNNASNRTWRHADGSEVRVHQHGNASPSGYKSGNNAHVHKQDSSGRQLNDRGKVRPVGDETHIGIKNPSDLPVVRGRPHGDGS
ncbi:hypothetical protein G7047_11860 [Diaphorobacter sp. HDW4A]|uniref:RHS repeat-associated core domain-containing protein n=1 Tax=Diaphorobacter sp. HDW4A TaxID=2714924 RepID=UPI00140E1A31|nr:RHS repeat-associated core domain-containing protein [Diaphorobacter sp. HDW4A]QIL80520.1 hypothetical protein G7047_11860 [Diaphorobacter sp. HDW4A]